MAAITRISSAYLMEYPVFHVLLYVRDAQPRRSDSGPHWLYRLQTQPAAA